MRPLRSRWRAPVWQGFALVLVLAAGCAAPTPSREAVEQDVGMLHVHGLAVDPDDGDALYAATHTGLFHIAEGVATRRGEGWHDLMGFTVVGPGDFLASGHPDLRDESLHLPDTVPLLGLVGSGDGGRTWRSLSLLGEADFHALRAAHGLVYGADATGGRFMVTTDRASWETRSQAQLADFAVSPDDADLIIGTFADGVRRSRDGGRTWEPAAAVPLLLLSWDGQWLYGATAAGEVQASEDDGVTWQPRGRLPGEPGALLAHGGRLFAALRDGAVVRSEDDGATWQQVVAPVNEHS